MVVRMKLAKSKIVKVEGPAFIRVVEGALSVLGRELTPREHAVIPKSKVMVFKAEKDSVIELRVGEGGKFEELDDVEITVPPEWSSAADRILNYDKPISVIVLGNVDSGKTTFCTFLANKSFLRGFKTAVIDNDLGQSDIGPPTTIGLGFLERPVSSLSEVPLYNAFFAGSTSPNGLVDRVVVGARMLMDAALRHGAEVIIVNTSGWILGRGARSLKLALLLSLNPKIIVAIQREAELEHLLKPFQGLINLEIIRVPTPRVLRARNREERRFIREASYKKYLVGAKTRVISLDRVGLLFSFIGSGFPLPKSEIREYEEALGLPVLYGETSSDAIVLVVKGALPASSLEQYRERVRELSGKEEVVILPQGFERGLLAGVFSPQGKFLGLGVIREFNFAKRSIEILTPVDGEIGMLAIGSIKINESGREIRKLDSWTI